MVITVGLLFLLAQMRGGEFGFWRTYPFLLIVAGAILLASSLAPATGHLDITAGPPAPPPSNVTPSSPRPVPGPGR